MLSVACVGVAVFVVFRMLDRQPVRFDAVPGTGLHLIVPLVASRIAIWVTVIAALFLLVVRGVRPVIRWSVAVPVRSG